MRVDSRFGRRLGAAAAMLGVALLATSASAQDIQAFKPSVGTWNYFSIDGTAVTETGEFIPSMYLSYARNPLVERDDQGRLIDLVVENLTTVELLVGVGLHERFEVGAAIPFGYGNGSGNVEVDTGGGLGDLRLLPKLILLGVDGGGFGLALNLPMLFPTGEGTNSSRYFIMNPELVAELRTSVVRFAVNAGYRWRPTNTDTLEPLTVGDGITYGAGLAVKLGGDMLEAIAEGYGTVYSNVAENQGGPNPLEALVGLRLFNQTGLVFTLAGGAGIVADFGAPEMRVIGGLSWMPRADEPQQVMIAGGAIASQAVAPDGDDDEDGVKNSADRCPQVAEDADGFEDADGCPDNDNDQDGLADGDDQCPKHAEDIDGFEDADGCPDRDNDKDGIADSSDRCPDLAENRNGVDDSDGCPDSASAAGPRVVVKSDRIQHFEKIYFETGRAKIRPESFSILDAVAEAILAHPEIRRVRVEGHTDAYGTAGYNLWLSRLRAAAVREYLVKSGVDASRLESVGLGEDALIGNGISRIDAARSRRVEFIIRERRPAGAPAPQSVHSSEAASAKLDGRAEPMQRAPTEPDPVEPEPEQAVATVGAPAPVAPVAEAPADEARAVTAEPTSAAAPDEPTAAGVELADPFDDAAAPAGPTAAEAAAEADKAMEFGVIEVGGDGAEEDEADEAPAPDAPAAPAGSPERSGVEGAPVGDEIEAAMNEG